MKTALYAIRDITACSLLGGVHIFKHDAPAVRFFGDVANDQQTMIARHPTEHELICLGYIDDDSHVITPLTPPVVVITGAAWKAAQLPREAAAE